MKPSNTVAFAVGWYGVIALLLAYILVSFGYLSGESVLYQTLQITGAAGVLWDSFTKRAYPAAVLNAVWILIGIAALYRVLVLL